MNFHHTRSEDELQGQAAFGMANLRSSRTGLPFIVFISQKDGAKHDVRVKVSPNPKVHSSQMGSYSLRPYRHVGGYKLTAHEEKLLRAWTDLNIDTLVGYWDGLIEYTEDAIAGIKPIPGPVA